MRRVVFIALVVLSAVVAVVGVWSFRRDEYPVQFTREQIVSVHVVSLEGYTLADPIGAPPPELAAWIDSMERVPSDVQPRPFGRLIVDLDDGRRLELDVGPEVSLGRWTAGPQMGRAPVLLATENDLYWYVRGVFDALQDR